MCKKGYIWNSRTSALKNGAYLKFVIDDSILKCGEITHPINLKDKKATCKVDNFYNLLTFSLINTLLMIINDIYYYYYHIKHRSNQKQILSYYHSNGKLKEINITNIM